MTFQDRPVVSIYYLPKVTPYLNDKKQLSLITKAITKLCYGAGKSAAEEKLYSKSLTIFSLRCGKKARLLVTKAARGELTIMDFLLNHEYEQSIVLRANNPEYLLDQQIPLSAEFIDLNAIYEKNEEVGLSLMPVERLHFLNNEPFIFNNGQNEVQNLPLPAIIYGAAGSGKTLTAADSIQEKIQQWHKTEHAAQSSTSRPPKMLVYCANTEGIIQLQKMLQPGLPLDVDIRRYCDFITPDTLASHSQIGTKDLIYIDVAQSDFLKNRLKQPRMQKEMRELQLTEQVVYSLFRVAVQGTLANYQTDKLTSAQRAFIESRLKEYIDYTSSGSIAQADFRVVPFELKQPYDFLVIDEGQNRSPNEIVCLQQAVKGQALIFMDSQQTLNNQGHCLTLPRLQQLHHAFYYHRLGAENWRSKPAIVDLLNQILKLGNHYRGGVALRSNYTQLTASSSTDDLGAVYRINGMTADMDERIKAWGRARSVRHALIVPADKFAEYQERYGKHGVLVFTEAQSAGLEFDEIAYAQALSSPEASSLNRQTPTQDLLIKPNQPKSSQACLSLAAENFLNSLFVACSRARNTLYFIQESTRDCDKMLRQLIPGAGGLTPQKIQQGDIATSTPAERQDMLNLLQERGLTQQIQALKMSEHDSKLSKESKMSTCISPAPKPKNSIQHHDISEKTITRLQQYLITANTEAIKKMPEFQRDPVNLGRHLLITCIRFSVVKNWNCATSSKVRVIAVTDKTIKLTYLNRSSREETTIIDKAEIPALKQCPKISIDNIISTPTICNELVYYLAKKDKLAGRHPYLQALFHHDKIATQLMPLLVKMYPEPFNKDHQDFLRINLLFATLKTQDTTSLLSLVKLFFEESTEEQCRLAISEIMIDNHTVLDELLMQTQLVAKDITGPDSKNMTIAMANYYQVIELFLEKYNPFCDREPSYLSSLMLQLLSIIKPPAMTESRAKKSCSRAIIKLVIPYIDNNSTIEQSIKTEWYKAQIYYFARKAEGQDAFIKSMPKNCSELDKTHSLFPSWFHLMIMNGNNREVLDLINVASLEKTALLDSLMDFAIFQLTGKVQSATIFDLMAMGASILTASAIVKFTNLLARYLFNKTAQSQSVTDIFSAQSRTLCDAAITEIRALPEPRSLDPTLFNRWILLPIFVDDVSRFDTIVSLFGQEEQEQALLARCRQYQAVNIVNSKNAHPISSSSNTFFSTPVSTYNAADREFSLDLLDNIQKENVKWIKFRKEKIERFVKRHPLSDLDTSWFTHGLSTGKIKIIRLLNQIPNINPLIKDSEGNNAMHILARNSFYYEYKQLMKTYMCSPEEWDQPNRSGCRPIYYAISQIDNLNRGAKSYNLGIIEFFLDNGSKLIRPNDLPESYNLPRLLMEQSAEIPSELSTRIIQQIINEYDPKQYSETMQKRMFEWVGFTILAGKDQEHSLFYPLMSILEVTCDDSERLTKLVSAVIFHCKPGQYERLFNYPALITESNGKRTLLHHAAEAINEWALTKLLEHENINKILHSTDEQGQTALDLLMKMPISRVPTHKFDEHSRMIERLKQHLVYTSEIFMPAVNY